MAKASLAPGPARLLILDDDRAVCDLIGHIAEGEGFEWCATSAAVDFFDRLDDWRPTHIVLDLIIPGMDGIEILRALGARHCLANIVIVSGTGSRVVDAARRSAAEHGLNIVGVLQKPFLPSELRMCLAERAMPAATDPPTPAGDPQVREEELRQALDRRRIELHFQPKIVCASGALAGHEALARLRRPNGEIVPPDRFIPLAEKTGLIDSLSELILELALDWLTRRDAPENLTLSVNLSPSSLHDIYFADRIAEGCRQRGVAPERMIFELTETSAMRDPVTALDLLTRLRLKGFRLSIDDFGTGYSSALQLVRLPFSEMKLDKSFVMTASTSAESRTVIKSIVDLGHNLGLWTTAEGVEDVQALDFLRDIGCDLAQGYLIAKPMAFAEAAAWRPPPEFQLNCDELL